MYYKSHRVLTFLLFIITLFVGNGCTANNNSKEVENFIIQNLEKEGFKGMTIIKIGEFELTPADKENNVQEAWCVGVKYAVKRGTKWKDIENYFKIHRINGNLKFVRFCRIAEQKALYGM